MFRHVVMVRFTDEMTEDGKAALRAGLARLPDVIPEIRAYRFGDDLGLNEGNFDFVVTADFDAADGYLTYRDHPEHQQVVKERLAPFVAKRAAVQFEWPSALPPDLPG